jgi:hypothetical protein
MESQFDCAGICVLPDFYMFSDVNQAPPTQLCKDFAVEFLKTHSNKYSSMTIAASAVGLFGFIVSLCVLYYKNNKLEHSWEKYQQMRFA